MRPAYIGVDVAIAKNKLLPIAICTWSDGRFVPEAVRQLDLLPPRGMGNAASLNGSTVRRFVLEARTYIMAACERLAIVPTRIGIDAPSAPRRPELVRRSAEAALDRAGISCFATPSEAEFSAILDNVALHLEHGGREDRIPHANQLWMRIGFALFAELSQVASCLEVFPHASARMIGSGNIHKSQAGAVATQLAAAAAFTGWPVQDGDAPLAAIAWGASHDQLDAYLSAWVAGLDDDKRTALGDPPHDVIWVPKVDAAALGREPQPVVPSQPRALTNGVSLLCPACGEKRFQRWPWGWDAHAAHRCRGLSETEPERRKEEFRLRFESYFKR